MPGNVDNKLIYHLGVLIPFWVLELICEILVIAGGAIGLSAWIYDANSQYCYYDNYDDYVCYSYFGGDLGLGYGAFGGALGLGIVFLIMHIIQIALFGRRKLTPAANFGIELSRLIIWLAIFILEIVAFVYGYSSILTVVFVSAVWVLFLGSTIYSIVLFHRARRGYYSGSLGHNTAAADYSAPAAYQTQQTPGQSEQYGPGPYQAPGVQQNYGPGPYQHPSEMQQQTQYHQPNQYQQQNQYQQHDQSQQPNQYQQTSYPPSYGHTSPQPSHGQSAYSPPQQQAVGSGEKELASRRYP